MSAPSLALLSQITLAHGEPATRVVLKASRQGTTGANLKSSTFSDAAPAPFPAGPEAAPFTGAFQPAEPLSGFNGQPANGAWRLQVSDVAENTQG